MTTTLHDEDELVLPGKRVPYQDINADWECSHIILYQGTQSVKVAAIFSRKQYR